MYVDDEEKKLFLFWNQCFSYHIVHCGLQLVSIFLECFFGGYISLLIPLILEISRLSYIFTVMKSRAFLLSEMKSSTYFAWIISLSLTTAKHCVLFASFTSVIRFTNKSIFSLHTAVLLNREREWHCIWQNALMGLGFQGDHHNPAIDPNTMNDVNTSYSITRSISTEFFPLYLWLKQENLRKTLKIEWSNFFLYVKDIFGHAPETIDNISAWYFLHFNTSSLRDCHNVVA